MTFELCESRGFDKAAIAQRLNLVGLARPEFREHGKTLQTLVIAPNVDSILDRFYDSLLEIDEFKEIVSQHSDNATFKNAQRRYITSLGVDVDQRQYFEDRLRVGSIHQELGVPQSLYQCSFQSLQCLLIEYIPQQLRHDVAAFEGMVQFILKVTILDMSLAVECYCAAKTFDLEKSLKNVRGETKRLHHLAVTDSLTGLHNHSYSKHFLSEALQRASLEESPLCVIMADLDHFKGINDAYGHLDGDQILRIAAKRMTSGSRAGDELCRYGGEEFLFILQNTDIAAGQEVAERVRAHINSNAFHGTIAEIKVSLSLGVAQAREGDTVDALIGRADAALYAAKLAGRDCVRLETRE